MATTSFLWSNWSEPVASCSAEGGSGGYVDFSGLRRRQRMTMCSVLGREENLRRWVRFGQPSDKRAANKRASSQHIREV